MSYLPFAILAQFLNSVAVTIDKFLLTQTVPDPLIYIFYFSLISSLALFAIPFVQTPAAAMLILASLSTVAWISGAYLMLTALKAGQVQRVIPVIGAATPIFLLLPTFQSLSLSQITAIIILIAGLLFLTLEDLAGKFNKKELLLEIISALFFALSYYLLRLAFEKQGFLTVLVWSRPVLIPLGILILIIPGLRRKITSFLGSKQNRPGKGIGIFVFGQVSAAASELLLWFSISLASPAIVNSLQGIKYVFLLLFSLILGKKFPDIFKISFKGIAALSQILGVGLVGMGLYILAFSS